MRFARVRVLRTVWFTFWLAFAGSALGQSEPGAVFAWGGNSYGQTTVPGGLSNIVDIATGYFHSLALSGDGRVFAWGQWYSGISSYTAVTLPAGISNVVAIAGGLSHSLALNKNGTVAVWGYGYFGQTNLPAGLSNVIAIAAGSQHSLALRSNRTVLAWGSGAAGQTKVPPWLTNVVSIAAGQMHSLALRADGTVVAWGSDAFGQTNVPGGLSNVVSIAAGDVQSLALRNDGTVVEWGQFNNGGFYTNVTAPSGLSNVVAIAGGSSFAMALRTDGRIVFWGNNSSDQFSPPSSLSGVTAIAAGSSHCLAISPVPVIISQPNAAIELAAGAGTNLSVTIVAGGPYSMQWLFEGSPITGATDSNLLISNFNLAQAGAYALVAANQYNTTRVDVVLRLLNSPAILVDGMDIGGGSVGRVDSCVIALKSSLGNGANIYYTLDGSAPDFSSTLYSGPFALTSSATIRAIVYNSAYTSSAESAPVIIEILGAFPLQVTTPGGGTISQSPPPYQGNRYVSNAIVTLQATPLTGWSFIEWSGDAKGSSNVATVQMEGPRSVQATFGCYPTLSTNGNGAVLIEPGTGPYAYGSTVRLSAMPAAGAYFFGWAGDARGFANPMLLGIINPPTVTALFAGLKSNQVSLTTLVTGQGTVVVTPAKNVYTNGETVVLTATTAQGYAFKGWAGNASTRINPLTQQLNASQVITADFIVQSIALTNSHVTLRLGGQATAIYQLQYTTNLSENVWLSLGTPVSATEGTVSSVDSISTDTQRFYRLLQQ